MVGKAISPAIKIVIAKDGFPEYHRDGIGRAGSLCFKQFVGKSVPWDIRIGRVEISQHLLTFAVRQHRQAQYGTLRFCFQRVDQTADCRHQIAHQTMRVDVCQCLRNQTKSFAPIVYCKREWIIGALF
ncbi:hypothetical protein [Pectobacterium brasiliense]|uniref:hypothetical protein n=1 Tax=Pectobacterium brasiliense TaxID=180957 RepID=UPI001F079DCD|nr:hypothetical protein [Pectobacterium brasiliense]